MANGRKRLAPLKWVAHEIPASSANSLRAFTQSVKEKMATADVKELPPATMARPLSLPTLPDSPLQKVERLLQAAAEVEHALMAQYLYAGNGFAVPQRDPILNIAIEEMSHLMTVQNLLRLTGSGPHLDRQDFGPGIPGNENLFPFDLMLEPVSHVSLAKYVVAESPESLPADVNPVVMAHISDLANPDPQGHVNRVGTLYALLGVVFGSEQLLQRKAATGDPWYVTVNNLAAVAAVFYGDRDKLHLPDSAFHPSTATEQGTDQDWDRSVTKANVEFRVHAPASREEALEALRDIGLQGEGPSAPSAVALDPSHFKRFYDLFIKFFGNDGMGTNPPPQVASVPSAAVIVVDENSLDPNAISHPETVLWARLANLRYAMLLGCLEMYLRTPPASRQFLRGWAFAEMYGIRKLAEWLPRMPRNAGGTPAVASFPFSMPAWATDSVTWDDLAKILESSAALIAKLLPKFPVGEEHGRVLYHLQSSDSRKLAEAKARSTGASARTKADRARETLDWAAGVGSPHHNGSSPSVPDTDQGRFWNLPLAEFKETEIFGSKVVEIPAGGGDPKLIEVIRKKQMPKDRLPLTEDSPEFKFLEDWVRGGCKDEPV